MSTSEPDDAVVAASDLIVEAATAAFIAELADRSPALVQALAKDAQWSNAVASAVIAAVAATIVAADTINGNGETQ